jgi:hypothetical protein
MSGTLGASRRWFVLRDLGVRRDRTKSNARRRVERRSAAPRQAVVVGERRRELVAFAARVMPPKARHRGSRRNRRLPVRPRQPSSSHHDNKTWRDGVAIPRQLAKRQRVDVICGRAAARNRWSRAVRSSIAPGSPAPRARRGPAVSASPARRSRRPCRRSRRSGHADPGDRGSRPAALPAQRARGPFSTSTLDVEHVEDRGPGSRSGRRCRSRSTAPGAGRHARAVPQARLSGAGGDT